MAAPPHLLLLPVTWKRAEIALLKDQFPQCIRIEKGYKCIICGSLIDNHDRCHVDKCCFYHSCFYPTAATPDLTLNVV